MAVDEPTDITARPEFPIDGAAYADPIRGQIRGSALLLLGQIFSLGLAFATQVLLVRYLSKSDYGAFAYALAVVAILQTLSSLGLSRTVARFVSISHERSERQGALGTIVLAFGSVLAVGVSLVVLVLGFKGLISSSLIHDRTAVSVLAILVVLAPVQAIDDIAMALFAVFGRVRSIFVRTYVLAPSVKLAAVIALVATGSGPRFLAAGFVVGGTVGLAIYATVLVQTLRSEGLLDNIRLDLRGLPVRKVLGLSVPLLAADFAYVLISSSDAVLLGHFRGTREVAAFKAVQPAARLNEIVFLTFTMLYTPLAARLFARRNHEALGDLYWQAAAWITVISFPIFALTFAFAKPLTLLMFGSRYGGSATFLAILSIGYYAQALFGFNGTTIMIYAKVRYILFLSGLAVLVNLSLNLVLIPRYGAMGAAIGTAGTLVAYNLFKQIGLWIATGIRPFDRRYTRVYTAVAVAAVALAAVGHTMTVSAGVALGLTAIVSAPVLWINRDSLRVGHTFPELLRMPLGRRLFGQG